MWYHIAKTISRNVSSYHFRSWDTCLLSNFNNQFHCQASINVKWINDGYKILPNRAIPILPETMQNGHFLCIILLLCLFGNKRKISLLKRINCMHIHYISHSFFLHWFISNKAFLITLYLVLLIEISNLIWCNSLNEKSVLTTT